MVKIEEKVPVLLRNQRGRVPSTTSDREAQRIRLYRQGTPIGVLGVDTDEVREDVRGKLIKLVPLGFPLLDEETGLYHRAGTDHLRCIRACHSQMAAAIPAEGDTVLDVGAHVGSWCTWVAKHHRPSKVVAFEAAPDNFEILQMNTKGTRVKAVHAAVVEESTRKTSFFITANHEGPGSCLGCAQPKQGRREISVPARCWRTLLDKYQPGFVKMDIEGGEEHLDWSNLPPCLRGIALELHIWGRESNHGWAGELLDLLYKQGFYFLHGPLGLVDRPYAFGGDWSNRVVLRRA